MDAPDDAPPCPKTCEVCGRSFSKMSHLLRHSRSHADDRPFNCPSCNKGFARTDALQRHQRTMHSGTKRRRRDSGGMSGNGGGGGIRNGTASMVPPTPLPAAHPSSSTFDPLPLQGWYDEPRNAMLSTSTSFMDLPFMEESVVNSNNSPQSMFFGAFPNTAIPSSGPEVNEMIAQWLNQDAANVGADRALVSLFSNDVEQQHTAYPFQQPSSRPGSSRQRLNNPADDPPQAPAHPTPRSTATTTASTSRHVLTADTWESGLPISHHCAYSTSRATSPQPPELTSPEQVVGHLEYRGKYVSLNVQDRDTVIPSMKFLDVCIHLYFRCFHPSLPVIHQPTFSRDKASWHLLLSMVSIGCMFVGTQAARESGRWIHHRLHLSTVLAERDADMQDETTRGAMILSAILGQAFSCLYGQPQQMLTAETYHEPLCTMARRNGLLTKVKPNPVSYADVEHLDSTALGRKWREWARQETFRRVILGLTIQGAELTIYSSVARLIPAVPQVLSADFTDALFEAEDAEAWRDLLIAGGAPPSGLSTSKGFQPTVLLSQALVHIYMLRQLETTSVFGDSLPLRQLAGFYDHIAPLAKSVGIWPALAHPTASSASAQTRSLAALWHYLWVARLTPTSVIEDVAGRSGAPSADSIVQAEAWCRTRAARLATLHCGYILYRASDLNDLGFLLPRIVFQATVVLLCYISLATDVDDAVVDILQVTDWERLVRLHDEDGDAGTDHIGRSPQERYVAEGRGMLRVPGFVEGKERQMDTFTLRSTSNLLLRRCTPWGIGATLGDILSNLSFQV